MAKSPLGFSDGISQPTLDWKRQRTPREDELEYGNLLSLGEFLLGYPNEYGKYTDRPLFLTMRPQARSCLMRRINRASAISDGTALF